MSGIGCKSNTFAAGYPPPRSCSPTRTHGIRADGGANVPVIHTVTNQAEKTAHTHFLAVGTPVVFLTAYDNGGNPTRVHNVMWVNVGVDVYSGSTLIMADAHKIGSSPVNNTSGVLQFVSATVGGSNIANLLFQTSGVPDYAVLGVVSGNVVFDYPRVN
jgi:hypothetical protein